MIPARIERISQETPTVKSFRLALEEHRIAFNAGQWVDLYLQDQVSAPEGVVGGFSITSAPLETDSIELAVKRIPWGAASVYLHESARVGDAVIVDGGYGDFYYRGEMGGPLVLLAGGIGITPLMSIVRYVDQAALEVDVALLYSAGTPSELIFREELSALASKNPRIRCHFTVTGSAGEPWEGRVGRIGGEMLAEAGVDQRALYYALYYICGPRGFAADMGVILAQNGVDPALVKSESW